MALYGALKLLNFPFYQENLLHDDVFQGDESSADIELKDLGGGVTMLHHEDHEGHFEDMKLGSSSSASRSPSYQSANTSINSRDIEIPRSKLSISSPPRICIQILLRLSNGWAEYS